MLISGDKHQRRLLEMACFLAVPKDAMFVILLAACSFFLSPGHKARGTSLTQDRVGSGRGGSEESREGLFASTVDVQQA